MIIKLGCAYMTIKIVTDSTADLSQTIANQFGIKILPLQILLDGKSYTDRVDITPSEFMQKMKTSKELPKSSQPSLGAFLEAYNELTSDGREVISIHITGGMSGTVQTAMSAAEQCEGKVTVVNSMFISKALTFQVIEAAKMAKEGKTVQEILQRLDKIRENTKLFVVVDTLENLVKGGRIGRGKALLGSLLKIKPIAALEDGVYTPVSKARSYNQVVKELVKRFKEDVDGKVVKGIGLVHADGKGLASQLKEKLLEIYEHLEIVIENTTPIISTHTGPGAIGFMYFAE